MNLIMKLLEILFQITIILMFSYSILTYWGFDTKHFLMIAEGQVPKRVQSYQPPKTNTKTDNEIPSNTEVQSKNTDEDNVPTAPQSSKSNSSTSSTTTLE